MLTEDEILELIARIKEDLREQAVSISKTSGVEKRRKVILKSSAFVDSITQLENHGNQYGFTANEIDNIVSVITLPYLEIAMKKKILCALNPRGKVNPEAVICLISALSSSTADMKKLIMKWLCLTYPYSSNQTKITYSKLYSCIFYYLDDEELLPYTCHLLYIITTRQTVKPFRSRRLLQIYQHGMKTGQVIKPLYLLLQLYAQYDPSILIPLPPKTNIGYSQFQHVDDSWNEVISLIQHINQVDSIESSTILLNQKKYIDFRMNSQLFFQTNFSLATQDTHYQWPHSYSLTQTTSQPCQAVDITLEQINSSSEVATCLSENRVKLTVPDQSLCFFNPDVFSHSVYLLKWSTRLKTKKERLFQLLPTVLPALLLDAKISDLDKNTLTNQLYQFFNIIGQIPAFLISTICDIVLKCGVHNKSAFLLLRFIPEEEINRISPKLKQQFHLSSKNQQSTLFAGIIDCCLHMRSDLKFNSDPSFISCLQAIEGLLESCIMQCLIEQPSLLLQSLYCEYLLNQMNIQANYYYIPHDTIINLLLLSNNAIIINAICLFVQILKLHTQANPNCGFLTITNRLEGMLRTKYSMTSLSYSSAFGYFYKHMIDKEKQSNHISEESDTVRFKKCLHRYQLLGLDRFLE